MNNVNHSAAPIVLPSWFRQLVEFVFYGNYFYGICAVAAILETSVQLKLPVNDPYLLGMSFMATVLFYNYPYARNDSRPASNPRTEWHTRYRKLVAANQVIFTTGLILCGTLVIIRYPNLLSNVDLTDTLLFALFPLTGAMYYGSNVLWQKYRLRQIGWLKPFVIGFVWAGMSNTYPLLYAKTLYGYTIALSLFPVMLFLKAFMFTSMLAIMFDIKDYVADSRSQLNTLIVKIGLRKTVFWVIIPLTLLGLLTFVSYAFVQGFSFFKMVLIMIPFVLLIAATRSFRKRRSLIFYLVVIDGLFIVKAIFDIVAMFV